jgi:hypothetical protein
MKERTLKLVFCNFRMSNEKVSFLGADINESKLVDLNFG